MRLASLNGCNSRAWVCFIAGCLYAIQPWRNQALLAGSGGMCQEAKIHLWEIPTCVTQVFMMKLTVSGCVWISKHNTCIILGASTNSSLIPRGFGAWFLLTTNYVYSTSLHFFPWSNNCCGFGIANICVAIHDSTVGQQRKWNKIL